MEVGDPVITSQGLVGIVTNAYATTSKVTTLLSEDVKVSAVDPACGESGVIVSDITTASAGLLRMSYLGSDTQVKEGDIITTSGAGSTYPKDIIIGVVESVQKSENDISQMCIRDREGFSFPTGFAAEIPQGLVGLVFCRSGLGVKHGVSLPNCVGVIDSDYRGELIVPLRNFGAVSYTHLKTGRGPCHQAPRRAAGRACLLYTSPCERSFLWKRTWC